MWSGIDNLHSEQNKEVTNSPCTSYCIVFGLLLTANNPATNNKWNGTYLIQLPKTMFFRICSSLSPTRSINAALYITDFHLQFSAQCVAHINKMCYFCTRNNKGEVLEWLKRHAWKACIRLKRIGGSNPPLSAYIKSLVPKLIQLGDFLFYRDADLSPLVGQQPRECARNITTILQQSTDFTAAI